LTDADSAATPAGKWLARLQEADKAEKPWRERGREIVKRFRDDERETGSKINILWSNTETLKASAFNRMPKPDVRRRFADRDPVAKAAALMLERALEYCTDRQDSYQTLSLAVDDMLLPGRGQVRLVYEAETVATEAAEGEAPSEAIAHQEVRFEYVPWQDFRRGHARHWEECEWVAFRHEMDRDTVVKRFPEHGDKLTEGALREDDDRDKDEGKAPKRIEVWEIWDKAKKQRFFIARGYSEILEATPDPYKLEGFWPIPRPLYAILAPGSLIPIPLYTQYQDQALELDRLSERIAKMVDSIKRRGVYDASMKELARLADAGDNEFIGVETWARLAERGGLNAAMQAEDFSPTIAALAQLYQNRAMLVQSIYEITGISDVIRGSGSPGETATAQRLKGQFGGLRLRKIQDEIQRFVRDLFRMKAELIAEHYEPEQLAMISGTQMQPEALAQVIGLLRSEKMRGYRVDVESDTTAFEDAEAEKKARIEFVSALTQFGQTWIPLAGQSPPMAKLAGEVMGFAVRGFKAGRQLEDAVDEVMASMAEQAAQPKPPPTDPLQMKLQADMQMQQVEAQIKQQEAAGKMQSEQQKAALEQQKAALEAQSAQVDMQIKQADAQLTAQLKTQAAQIEQQHQQIELQIKYVELQIKMADMKAKMMPPPPPEPLAAQAAPEEPIGASIERGISQFGQTLATALTQPRSVVRGPDGRIAGVS